MADETLQPSAGGESDVEQALAEAQHSIDDLQSAVGGGAATGVGHAVDTMADSPHRGEPQQDIDLLGDVDLEVSIELGRAEMMVEDVLRLGAGSVVELDKLAGDPVDVFVNGRIVARGEVLVLNDNFCIRISEIVDDLQEELERAAETAES